MRAIAYIRASTDRQSITLEAQREKIIQYAVLKDMELVEIVEDAGISGKSLDRPGVQLVLEKVQRKEVDYVVVFKLDRMFRSTTDALTTAKLMKKCGVALHSVCETIDTDSPMGTFFFTLLAALADLERNLISERTKTALQHKRSLGRCVGQVPYGFRREGDDLVPDAEEQATIKLIKLLAENEENTYSSIARYLNAKQYTTKSGSMWHAQTVKNILMQDEKGPRHGR